MAEINPEVEFAAELAHESNRAYCARNGDFSHLPWKDAQENIKDSARNGVRQIINNPDTTPEQSHENWLAFKKADGWVYGPVKDMEKKTHPCMVPYTDLPEFDRVKDAVFGSVVRGALVVFGTGTI